MLIAKLHNTNISKATDAIKPRDVMRLNIDAISDKLKTKDIEKNYVEAKELAIQMMQRNGGNIKGIISKN